MHRPTSTQFPFGIEAQNGSTAAARQQWPGDVFFGISFVPVLSSSGLQIPFAAWLSASSGDAFKKERRQDDFHKLLERSLVALLGALSGIVLQSL